MMRRHPADWLVVFIGASILIASLALAAASAAGHDALPERDFCWSQTLFGTPCPGCGLTRSFVATASGQIGHASAYNPLGPPLFAAIALLTILHAASLAGHRPRRLGTIDAVIGSALAGMLVAHSIHFYVFV